MSVFEKDGVLRVFCRAGSADSKDGGEWMEMKKMEEEEIGKVPIGGAEASRACVACGPKSSN